MPDVDSYFDAIDGLRIQRVLELSEIKHSFSTDQRPDPLSIRSKAVVVLVYANWEGFYNECVRVYLDFLTNEGVSVATANWLMLVGALSSDFNSLQDRNHSTEARREFVTNLRARMTCTFDSFDRKVVQARSNLDFEKLKENFLLMAFDDTRLQPSRIRLDKELVGWRHAVAHGNPPNLSAFDVGAHVDFASKLMLSVSDLFQEAMLDYV